MCAAFWPSIGQIAVVCSMQGMSSVRAGAQCTACPDAVVQGAYVYVLVEGIAPLNIAFSDRDLGD